MAKSKKGNTVYKEERKKIDLNYRKIIEIVQMSHSDAQSSCEENIILIQEMREEINKNMEQYERLQKEVIKKKLESPSTGIVNQPIDIMREKYKDILKMYKLL